MAIAHFNHVSPPYEQLFDNCAELRLKANEAYKISDYGPERTQYRFNYARNLRIAFAENRQIVTKSYKGQLLGYMSYKIDLDYNTLRLIDLFVPPHKAPVKAGSELVEFLINTALSGGYTAIQLKASEYAIEKGFYQKHGFELLSPINQNMIWRNPCALHQ